MSKHILKKGWYDYKAKTKIADSIDRESFFAGADLVMKTIYNAAKEKEGFMDDFNDMARDIAEERR